MDEREWIPVGPGTYPPERVVVETKIDDQKGVRNVQPLRRQGGLYFFPDGTMYVYYTPTHWRHLTRD